MYSIFEILLLYEIYFNIIMIIDPIDSSIINIIIEFQSLLMIVLDTAPESVLS